MDVSPFAGETILECGERYEPTEGGRTRYSVQEVLAVAATLNLKLYLAAPH